MSVSQLKEKVLSGKLITREEALTLAEAPLDELCRAADDLRRYFCGNAFDICTIINAKSGRCSEDCKYCAQSAHYCTNAETYSLLDIKQLLEGAQYNDERGVLRYSLVTSGRSLNDQEIDQVCESIRIIRQKTNIHVCVSFGLQNEEQYRRLKEAGASRVHNNLESSPRFFKEVCTTHTTQDKINALQAAQRAGLGVCSGGIMGMGETMEDRIDMVLLQRELGVKSIPVNMLNPIPGTPFEHLKLLTNDDMCRIVAIFRFLVPDASIRLAGGRGLLPDKGEACFCSGANACISGDMLTTAGYTVESDLALIKKLGFHVELWEK